MAQESLEQRLSNMSTIWNDLQLAYGASADAANAAQALLLERYRKPVFRYLKGLLGDDSAADDLAQEFCLSLLKGEFRKADPQRGKFRHYVKGVLFHQVSKYRQKQRRLPKTLAPDNPVWSDLGAAGAEQDADFDKSWRDELLNRTWKALGEVQPTFATVLHFRANHPEMPSKEMAATLSQQWNKPVSADAVRQTLRRARELFAELLVEDVAHSLKRPTKDNLTDELLDLNLLEYCRPALEKMKEDDPG